MRHDGKIRARSKWKEVYPLFSSSSAYLDMLGTPGSNPLELFWDIVDELDQALDNCIAVAEKVFKKKEFTVLVDTPEEELLGVLEEAEKDYEDVKKLGVEERKEIWNAASCNDRRDEKRADVLD